MITCLLISLGIVMWPTWSDWPPIGPGRSPRGAPRGPLLAGMSVGLRPVRPPDDGRLQRQAVPTDLRLSSPADRVRRDDMPVAGGPGPGRSGEPAGVARAGARGVGSEPPGHRRTRAGTGTARAGLAAATEARPRRGGTSGTAVPRVSRRRTGWWPSSWSVVGNRRCVPNAISRTSYERFVRERPRALSDSDRELIRSLASDLPRLWEAPTTMAKDRQTIIRLLVQQVVVLAEGSSEHVDVTIHWSGGFVSRHRVRRPVARHDQWSNHAQLMERVVTLRD